MLEIRDFIKEFWKKDKLKCVLKLCISNFISLSFISTIRSSSLLGHLHDPLTCWLSPFSTKNHQAKVEGLPYYQLTSSDRLGYQIVSHPFKGMNYSTLRRSIIEALISKNKIGFVDAALLSKANRWINILQGPASVSFLDTIQVRKCLMIINILIHYSI